MGFDLGVLFWAAGIIVLLVLVMRWVFAPSRPRTGRPDSGPNADLGLLSPIRAATPRSEALRVKNLLSQQGIRCSLSRLDREHYDVLVFRDRPGPGRGAAAAVTHARRCRPPAAAPRLVGMAIHLTRIYTKTGDTGSTALGDLSRVPKTDPRVAAYADSDETNAALGVALALGNLEPAIATVLAQLQNDLFDVGADLSTPVRPDPEFPPLRITEDYLTRLEGWCDEYNARLGKLASFILPGGTPGARAAARGPHGRPAGRAQHLGVDRGRPRAHQPAGRPLPEPAVGPAVHPGPVRQPGRRRAVAARRPGRRGHAASPS